MVTYAEERSCITQFELGELFHKGEQRSRDYAEAFRWYKSAAIKGSRPAQNRLGAMYARGQGVNQDYVKAYAWCKVAAFQKSKRAQRMLKHIENKMCLEELRRGRWLGQEYYDRFVARRLRSR